MARRRPRESDEYGYYGGRRRFEPMAIVGLVATVLLHGGIVGVVYWRRVAEANAVPPPQQYVVARLVRLGKKREPKKLPNKIVPRPATKKPEAVSYDAQAEDPPQPKKTKKPDPEARTSDRMRRALDKAALFEEAQREIEAEGDPAGVEGGTATEAGAGDPYITRIADLWTRTWTLPVIISQEEAKRLSVLLVLRIDRQGNIELPIEIDQSSGNDHFDNSVKTAWQQIRKLPLPPPDRLATIMANGLALKLTWRGLQ